MAKRSFTGLVITLLFVLQPALAQVKLIPIDGCGKLARVIYSEVSAAALYGTQQAGPWTIALGQGDLAICSHTAKTVSQAFTSAMMSAGIDVAWQGFDSGTSDYCLTGSISQCYPDRGRFGYSSGTANLKFVAQSWSAVSQVVMREMYNPHSSDEVRFRDDDLKLRLGLSLREIAPYEQASQDQRIPNLR